MLLIHNPRRKAKSHKGIPTILRRGRHKNKQTKQVNYGCSPIFFHSNSVYFAAPELRIMTQMLQALGIMVLALGWSMRAGNFSLGGRASLACLNFRAFAHSAVWRYFPWKKAHCALLSSNFVCNAIGINPKRHPFHK